MASEAIIELTNVWKTYSMGDVKVHALKGLTLKVKKGQFLAIMGPSGSGKSTAMNMIGCLDVPSKGEVHEMEGSKPPQLGPLSSTEKRACAPAP